MKKGIGLFNLCLLSAITATGYAAPTTHYLVVPQCLIKQVKPTFNTLATKHDYVLVKSDQSLLNKLITAKANHKTTCGGFLNVTDDFNQQSRHQSFTTSSYGNFLNHYLPQDKPSNETKYKIQYEKQVANVTKLYIPEQTWKDLTMLTAFEDRYANSKTGVDAANWFQTQIKDIAKEYNRDDIEVTTVATGSYKQPSVVVKIGKDNDEAGIVIGGHMDTLEKGCDWMGNCGNKPGADDDGSGSITTLETARAIIASGIKFKKPIYIVWYSAEEEGLIGSQKVVRKFKEDNIPVDAVLHFDMTGYANQNDPTMWLINDHVNQDLTKYLETLIDTYVKQPVKYTRCGYACSDHASWTSGGFAAAMPFESSFGTDNPDIHSENDTMDNLSLDHISDYVKLGIAFAVELAEPV